MGKRYLPSGFHTPIKAGDNPLSIHERLCKELIKTGCYSMGLAEQENDISVLKEELPYLIADISLITEDLKRLEDCLKEVAND